MGKKPVRGLLGLCWFGVALAAGTGCSWWGNGSQSTYQGNGKLLSSNSPPAARTGTTSGTTTGTTTSTAQVSAGNPTGGQVTPVTAQSWTSPTLSSQTSSSSSPVVQAGGLPQDRMLPAGGQGPGWGSSVPIPTSTTNAPLASESVPAMSGAPGTTVPVGYNLVPGSVPHGPETAPVPPATSVPSPPAMSMSPPMFNNVPPPPPAPLSQEIAPSTGQPSVPPVSPLSNSGSPSPPGFPAPTAPPAVPVR
jgi:hypothetical protein